ncbi:PREDICTED: borealin [Cyphomyrmex costatus]|uniref:borealin n=1 Tax=Cyphomyrmex costatus TaxID=456900 RepID=UPI0008522EE5|nr:PREDICTED: borealin [Cyphomyrmex costatus]
MPRTKRNKMTGSSMKERDTAIKTFEKRVQLCISKMERDAMADLKTFTTCIDVIISRLPNDIRQMKLGELIDRQDHDNDKENCNNEVSSSVNDPRMQPPAIPKVRRGKAVKRTAASDDGYATGGTSVGSMSRVAKVLTKATPAKKTRSTRASKAKLSEINQSMTPAMSKPLNNVYGVVTPKVKPNTPLNVLRRPRQGEMVLSMQGSPLLVSAVVEEKTANINVPLSNGNVMSLLPQEGLRMSNIPQLDPETMHQLETLKNHIEKVIAMK